MAPAETSLDLDLVPLGDRTSSSSKQGSMLSNTLNTNEVKNEAGTEVEFTRTSISDRKTVFAQIGESPSLTHRLTIEHQELGVGIKARRRSKVEVAIASISTVDSVTPVVTRCYTILDAPIGALTANTQLAKAIAELGSFLHTAGTNTHLYDGTGTGAAALLTGGL